MDGVDPLKEETRMTAVTHTPEDTIRRFSALLAEGDLDAMVDLYEPDAAFAPRPGEAVTGREAIREALRPFLDLEPRMTGEIERVLLAGVTADVLRRREDGSWGIAIDDPWGGGQVAG